MDKLMDLIGISCHHVKRPLHVADRQSFRLRPKAPRLLILNNDINQSTCAVGHPLTGFAR